MAPASSLTPLLTHAKTIVESVIGNTANKAIEEASQQLKSVVFAITSAGRHNREVSPDEETALWELVCLLWNTCVDSANNSPPNAVKECYAQMRQHASDLLSLVKDESASDDERLCKCQFFHKTGKLWSQLEDYETAEACYAKAMEYVHFLLDLCSNSDRPQTSREECAAELFDLFLDRTAVAWQLQQKALASNLLGRAKDLANNEDLSSEVQFQLNLMLANAQVKRAEHVMATPQADCSPDSGEAVGFLNTANEIIANLESEEGDPEEASKAAAANQMRAQVFSLLAWAHLEAGDKPAPALSCIHSLRQLPTELSNPSVISFLALKALCQLGKLNEAETELLSVVSSSTVSLSTCLGSVKLMLTAAGGQMDIDSGNGSEGGLAGVKSAISLIQERFADQPAVPVQLVRLLLAQEKVTEEAEQSTLDICAAESTVEVLTKEDETSLKQQLFSLLYSHATNHFQQRSYGPASRFFSAAYMYAQEGNKAKTARVMAVCNIAMKALDRALEYVDIAAQTEPSSVYNAFLRLKVYLLQQDSKAAAHQIRAMLGCEDFTHEILRVAAQEAMATDQAVVAKQALLQLHTLIEKEPDGTFQPGDEAMILSNLVKIIQGNADQAAEGASLHFAELGSVYHEAANRLAKVGYQQFFGADTTGRATALEWLAVNAWNGALQASEAKQYRDTAVLLAAAGKLYEAHPMPETSTVQYQTMAFLMATSATLEVVAKDTDEASVQSYLTLANTLLLSYQKAAQMLADRQQSLGEAQRKTEDKSHVYALIMEFELAVRTKDVQRQHAVLVECRETPSFTAENMLKLAAFSRTASSSSPDVTRGALHAALRLFLAKGHAVQYDHVAQTLRSLLEMSPTDEDKLKLYNEAKELLVGLPGDVYPDRELQWLVTTCWNRGAHQAKFQRCEAAEQYMRMALGLLEHCQSLSGRKQMMVDELDKAMQRKANHNRAEAPATSTPKDRKRPRPEEAEVAMNVPLTAITRATVDAAA